MVSIECLQIDGFPLTKKHANWPGLHPEKYLPSEVSLPAAPVPNPNSSVCFLRHYLAAV